MSELELIIRYWDSEGNRHINFNLVEEQKRFKTWLLKTYPPKQLSFFED